VLFVALLVAAVIFHESILTSAGNYLLVSDEPHHVDVIRVLGGSPDRYLYGVELFRQGYGDKLIFSLWDDYMPLLQRSKSEIISDYAQAEGLSPEDVTFWEAISTFHEAEMTLEYIEREQITSLIVVSSPYHMRRASIVFDHVIGDAAKIYYVPVPMSWSDYRADWWRSEESTVAVIHEYVAMIYYQFKYLLR